jgi:hypothetical protein
MFFNKIDTNICYKLEECGYNIEHKDVTIDQAINDIIICVLLKIHII